MNHPYDSLTPDCVVDCLESIGFVCDLRLLALNSYENRVYQVGVEGAQPIIMKFYRHGRWTDAQILEEHSFAQELVDHEISVVAPMRVNDKTLHHAHGQRFSVFERRGGYPPELDNLDHLYR
ncbi:phosphotransferase, partial [Luminiphilus sp.]|nr:phosphotransferase [Luminiphilus sp.]